MMKEWTAEEAVEVFGFNPDACFPDLDHWFVENRSPDADHLHIVMHEALTNEAFDKIADQTDWEFWGVFRGMDGWEYVFGTLLPAADIVRTPAQPIMRASFFDRAVFWLFGIDRDSLDRSANDRSNGL